MANVVVTGLDVEMAKERVVDVVVDVVVVVGVYVDVVLVGNVEVDHVDADVACLSCGCCCKSNYRCVVGCSS